MLEHFPHSSDFELVLDDIVTLHSCKEFFIRSLNNLFHIEIPEHLSISFTSIQYRLPRKSCLSSLKAKELKKCMTLMNRLSPFVVMIGYVEGVFHIDPATAMRSIHNFINQYLDSILLCKI